MSYLNNDAFKPDGFRYAALVFETILHLVVLVGIPLWLMENSLLDAPWLIFYLLMTFCGFGITLGYHRFYSHKSFKLARPVEYIFAFLGTLALQGSILTWVSNHRIHHKFVDTDKDPYSIKKGFWHAHMSWAFDHHEIKEEYVRDLINNPVLQFQHKYFNWLAIASNVLITVAIGYAIDSQWTAWLFCFCLRIICVHHFTGCVNSIAHLWGERPHKPGITAADSFIVSVLTYGEGYHNYHHSNPGDYRNGVKWYAYDPTKWLIFALEKLRLASGLKRVG